MDFRCYMQCFCIISDNTLKKFLGNHTTHWLRLQGLPQSPREAAQRAGGLAQQSKCLPGTCEVVSLITGTKKKKREALQEDLRGPRNQQEEVVSELILGSKRLQPLHVAQDEEGRKTFCITMIRAETQGKTETEV